VRAVNRAGSIPQAAQPVNAPKATHTGLQAFKVDCDKVASLFDDPNMTYGNDKNGSCQ
jgi:hypothetical protein